VTHIFVFVLLPAILVGLGLPIFLVLTAAGIVGLIAAAVLVPRHIRKSPAALIVCVMAAAAVTLAVGRYSPEWLAAMHGRQVIPGRYLTIAFLFWGALFVLAQSGSPRAREVLANIARGKSNPELQLKAVNYLGLFGGAESRKTLSEIYDSSSDISVKKAILRSFMVAGERDRLFEAAKTEKNPELRREAIRQLGVMSAEDQLWQLYQTETDITNRKEIIQAFFIGGGSERIFQLAKTEPNPELRRTAIRNLGIMGSKKTGEELISIYESDKDPQDRREALNGLFIQGNAHALVELAKKETDPAMKKAIVEKLSVMGSKEATDYLMELLKP